MFNGTVSHIVLFDFIEFESGFFYELSKTMVKKKGFELVEGD